MSDPLPCPFCGETDVSIREGSTFRWVVAECNHCGAMCGEVRVLPLATDDAYERAMREWNTRKVKP